MRDVMATKADLAEFRQELKVDINAFRKNVFASVRKKLGERIVGLLERNSLARPQAFGLAVSEVGRHHIFHGDAHGLVNCDLLI